MENPANEQPENIEENVSLTPIRDATVDIIGGARQTDQLDKLQANAQKHDSGNQTTHVSPLEVNDGTQPDPFGEA